MTRQDEPDSWQFAAHVDDIPMNGLFESVLQEQVVVLSHTDAGICAFQGLCPHQMARLSSGRISEGWLHCPQHMAKFQLTDGACGPGWVLPPLRRFKTKIIGDQVMVPNPLLPLT
tara:strand:+ start:35466 stop:35810 length:345 start_codon:yes stop_codon:yes gene_type:complete